MRTAVTSLIKARLSELHDFQNGMKTLSDENYLKLKREILETGFSFAVHAWKDKGKFWILDGHQRVECLRRMAKEEKKRADYEIPVIKVEAENLKEAKRKCLSAASQYGAFDVGGLVKTIEQAGIKIDEAKASFNFPKVDISILDSVHSVHGHARVGDDNQYTKKIDAPIYEPKGDKPAEKELCNISKCSELAEEILRLNLPKEIETFLLLSAQRHNVFDYEKIAEYYAHAPAEVQELMEKSALVIIDFKKAIENGFVSMTKEISEAYGDEQEE